MRRRVVVLMTSALMLAEGAAHCDPGAGSGSADLEKYLHIESPSHIKTQGGSELDLPPGYFLDENTHELLEADMHELQNTKTRLTAENASLSQAMSGWQPGFWTLTFTAVGCFVLGAYVARKL